MLERILEGHETFLDGNGNEFVLLHEFYLHGKAYPWNALLACHLPFPKDRIAGSDFTDVSFLGESGFTESSHVDVETDQLAAHKCCSSFWALRLLDVHQRS